MRGARYSAGAPARTSGTNSSDFWCLSFSLPGMPESFLYQCLASLALSLRKMPQVLANGTFHVVTQILQSGYFRKSTYHVWRSEVPLLRLPVQFRKLSAPPGWWTFRQIAAGFQCIEA